METAENNDISKDKTMDIKYSQLQCVFMINQGFTNGNLRYIKPDIDIEHNISCDLFAGDIAFRCGKRN
mgnify:FL=1